MKVIGHIAVDTAVFGICETFAKIVWSSGTAASAGSSTSPSLTQSMDSNNDSTISISVFVFSRTVTVVEDLGPHEYVMGVTLVDEGLDEDTSEQQNLDTHISCLVHLTLIFCIFHLILRSNVSDLCFDIPITYVYASYRFIS